MVRSRGIRQRRRNRRRERAILIVLMLLMLSIIGGGFYLFNFLNRGPVPNFEFVSLSNYRDIEPGTYIFLGDKILFEYEVLTIDGSTFIPLSFLTRFNGPHLHFEPYYGLVTLTTQTEMTRIPWPNAQVRNEAAYISTSDPLIGRFDIDLIYAFNGGDIKFIVVTDIYEEAYFTHIRNLSIEEMGSLYLNEELGLSVIPIRYEPYITSYVAAWALLDSQLPLYIYPYEYIYNEEESFYERVSRGGDDFTRVRTSFGEVGFIETSYLDENSVREARTRQPDVLPPLNNINGPITLAWDNIQSVAGNYIDRYRVANRGVNVFAPKWMRFGTYHREPTPTLSSVASHSYINFAHAHGIEVWPLLFDYQVNYVSSVILANPSNRDYIIGQLMDLASEFNFDGIMIDIEGLTQANFENFAQFIRELSPFMRERNLVYSVAVFVPRWRPWLDHNELARVSDFLAVMAYDENVAIWRDTGWNVDEIGPNASISFVYETIENMLWQGVPPEQLILGVPFYTPIWITEFHGDEILEDSSNVINISRNSWFLASSMNRFVNAGSNILWSDYYGSYFAYYYGFHNGNNARIEAWIESERSLVLKAEMARNHNLAGIAAWSRGMETPPIWDAIYYALR